MNQLQMQISVNIVKKGWGIMTNIEKAFAIANNAIYFNDRSDYRSALWEVCEILNAEKIEIGEKYIETKEKEKQEFQLGDWAYMIDEDYRFFESEVYGIVLQDGKYYYDTHDCEFEFKDIGDWVFKSEIHREIHSENL